MFIAAVNPMTILYSVLILLGLALVFGILLAVLGKKLAVVEDERIGEVKKHLSGANCGACGYAGCDAFAKAIVEEGVDVSLCNGAGAKAKEAIGDIMGVAISAEDSVIVVACAGGNNAADKYEYMGYGNCVSMELLGGGRKLCKWGCLGMGSCTDICPVHAIKVRDSGYAEVDMGRCMGCGKCVSVCPKRIVKRIPAKAKYYLACTNCLRGGKDVRNMCSAGCVGCGLCAKFCEAGAITLENNLPVFDYDKCTGCGLCAVKCPSKCIKSVPIE